jgi:hypothetical protein
MTQKAAMVKVGRHAVVARNQRIPATFFKHGQPGNRFVIYPEHLDRLSHVRVQDLDAVLDAYRQQLLARKSPTPPHPKGAAAATKSKSKPKFKSRISVAPVPRVSAATKTSLAEPPAPPAGQALREANRLAQELATLKHRQADGVRIDLRLLAQLERQHQALLNAHMRQHTPPAGPAARVRSKDAQ